MAPPDHESIEEATDKSTAHWPDFQRRPLLKALGIGATLSFAGGFAAGAGQDSTKTAGEDGDDQLIDPNFGYPTMDAAEIPADLDPAHEVTLAAAPPSGPGQPPFLYFDPVGLHVDAGDTVQFTFATPDHTVTAFHPDISLGPRVPEESSPFSSPLMGQGAAWFYNFEHEGVYDLYCGPHLILGMVMRLVVGDVAEEDLPEYARSVEGLPSSEQIAKQLNQMSEQNEDCVWPYLMPAGVLGADPVDPMNIQEAGEVPFSAVAEALGYEFQPPGQQTPGDEETPVETATESNDN